MITLVERLRGAGCVFAEDEAAVLREAARDDADLERMTAAREAGEPLEYVVGFADFCGVRVHLDPGVFIPRQRTEFLVRTAAELAPSRATVLDLCCGSGALGLAFVALRPDARVYAADVDPVAVRNARRHLLRVYESDLFVDLPSSLRGRLDVVLSNVPYVPSEQLNTMPVEARNHEPARTHDGGDDGLDVLRRLMSEAPEWLAPGGRVLAEISETQRAAALAIPTTLSIDTRYSDNFETTVVVATKTAVGPLAHV